uniref:RNA polymerase beta'' subunit n=1 Tax=Pellia epiphylla TaxID=40340 RepID=UPI002580E020|nr:RNA polymerase beta'' subunit [Pellia epiphylla]WIA67365.1 RNA polymerase beta'' subunit [Pellia epiphylla var. borealis]WIA67450.1 RNA polymerase beta'' subunit [Pellia epiphylla var. borealis]WIA67888.1 RNA polymerase beta'' subunit [Pellia epiphylla]WIA67973.1 RNA polymerase beta'' subunit [Pellia epiphylla]WIA68059.1 RNA polymerase beta'' subunit [Pellia epiphylla]
MAESANLIFYNKVIDRTAIRQPIGRLVAHSGIAYTTHVLDQLKALGFQQATFGAISLGTDDLLTVPSKGWLIEDAEQYGNLSEKHHNYGNLHAVEKLRQLIETWYATSEYLKQGMNPNFRMTDPSNPVHMMSFSGARGSTSQVHQLVGMRGLMSDPQGQIIDLPIQSNFREGLSLTEYIISCYGARKGVVDTAVRTSDAGYLTRRLVEVVQHIIVRKIDCGTLRGILISNYQGKRSNYQNLIGRVLSENIYINDRCFATRNQDIGSSLANELMTSKTEKIISVRSSLTCKSMLWICQLCYGWSLTGGNSIEVGEAVGIIAGQSIGEPGTQLTLRTFHTGGVFTGDIAEHVRTPFNGIIGFDGSLVHPTRTRHGHPAWICRTNLLLSIRGRNEIHNLTIPPKSLLLVQNSQYVESKQVVAEIRTKDSPFKEKVQKYIYSNLEGEMHWSTKVRHASEYIHSNIHSILETCHIWVLSGNYHNESDEFSVSFYRNQDKIEFETFLAEKESLSPGDKNQLNICVLNFYLSGKNRFFTKSKLTGSNIILYGYTIRKRGKNFFLDRKYTTFPFILEIPENGTLRNNDIFAASDHPKYESEESGTIKYGTVRTVSTDGNDYYTGTTRPKYRIVKGGNFFLIPEEIHVLTQSLPSSPVGDHEFIQANALIASNSTSGLIRIQKGISNTCKVRILPGTIYYPDETHKISKQVSILIPPKKKLFNEFQYDHWTYLQWIMPSKEKPFVSIRPVTEYKISNESDERNLLNLLGRKDTKLKIGTMNYLLYGDGDQIELVSGRTSIKNIRLIQTCLIVNWKKKYFLEKAHVSSLGIKIKKIFRNFLQISLTNGSLLDSEERRNNSSDSYNLSGGNDCGNSSSISRPGFISKHQGIIRRVLTDLNDGVQSFIILSPSDLIGVYGINNKDSIKERSVDSSEEFLDFHKHLEDSNPRDSEDMYIVPLPMEKNTIFDGLGFMGNLCDLEENNLSESFIQVISSNSSIIDRFRYTSKNPEWYFIDEYHKTHEFISEKNIDYRLFKRCQPPLGLSVEIIKIPNIGQFFFGNFYIPNYQRILPSGQIIAMHTNHLVIRSAKPFLATGEATIHNDCGESIQEGDTLITLIYERLKSGDIIQGLPKVEQLLEARSINSVSIDLDNGFENWSSDMKKFIGNLWGFFLSTRISMEQGQINLVDQIQRVYQSQGVHVSNKHIEIIVRQMTSRVVASEEGAIDTFLPGELIESSRARRMNRVLEEVILYEPILLGITKASLNTQSFVSEASFQETTRVLAKAASKGRIDWLRGLKENVILGGIIPAGTGSREVIWRMNLERKKEISSSERNNYFNKEIKNIFLYENIFQIFPAMETVHNVLKGSVSRSISN